MIDSHCHLADAAFADDVEAVVSRALAAGLTDGLCVLAMDEPDEWSRVTRVAALWPGLRFAVGIHPHQAGRFTAPAAESVATVRGAITGTPRACAVGEIGLDYHYDLSPRAVQRELFAAQAALAVEMELPVVVHTREAEADTRAILENARGLRGVLHCFTGTEQMARWAVDAGFHVSFAGIVTFANASALREVARDVPLDRLLVETDCPYLAPIPHRGQRNEPAYVMEVGRVIADLKQVTPAEFDQAVTENFVRLFGP
jgi:TatD DNase family protein